MPKPLDLLRTPNAEVKALPVFVLTFTGPFILYLFFGMNLFSNGILLLLWFSAGVFLSRKLATGGAYTEHPDLSDKVVVITGAAQGGIGFESAVFFAQRGATVFVGVRTKQRAEECAKQVAQEAKVKEDQIKPFEIDLSSLKSVKQAAQEILKRTNKIDILLNNAGIMMCPFSHTTDGIEMQMGTNHFGHFYFTELLLPTILESKNSRVVNVSSAGHILFGTLDLKSHFQKMSKKETYDDKLAYGDSKLANVYHAKELARRYSSSHPTFKAAALHPGAVMTKLGRHMGSLNDVLQNIKALLSLAMKTPFEGAQTSLYCCLSDQLVSGGYYQDCTHTESSYTSSCEKEAREWWEYTEEVLKEKTKAF